MKIAIFTDSYLPLVNGITTSLSLLNEQFTRMGHQVTVFAPHIKNVSNEPANVVRLKSIKIRENPPYYLTPPLSRSILDLVRQADFDIIHAHTPLTMGLLAYQAARLLKKPLIYTYHTIVPEYLHYLGWLSKVGVVRKGAVQFDLSFCNGCDMVVAPSAKVKDLLLTRGVSTDIQVVPNGVKLDTFAGDQRGYLRLPHNLKQADKILLAVGRLGKEKNPSFLINTFVQLRKRMAGVKLVFAGSGYLLSDLRELADRLGVISDIIFLGNVPFDDMPELYADADIFVSAAQTEAHPLALLEAIASGLPVVAVNDKAFSQAVVDGENGFLTPLNEELFADKLLNILSKPALQQNMAQTSRKNANLFSIEMQASKLLTIYHDLAISPRKRIGPTKTRSNIGAGNFFAQEK